MKRMVRVGKWVGAPSRQARQCAATFVANYFRSETVWTRKERSSYMVVAQESAKNTEEVERFRFNRPINARFLFRETEQGVEVELGQESTP